MAEGFLTPPVKPAYGLALLILTNIGLCVDVSNAETRHADSNVTSSEDHAVCPELFKGMPNVVVTVGDVVEFNIPEEAFTGNFSVMQLTSNSVDGKLPRWLYYNTSRRLFEGIPEADDVGTLEIQMVVGCGDCLESCTNITSVFSIIVQSESPTGIKESGNHLHDRCILQVQRMPWRLWAHVLAFPNLFSLMHLLPGSYCDMLEATDLALTLVPSSSFMENDKAKLLMIVSRHFNVDCSKLTILPLFVYASLRKHSGFARIYDNVIFKSLPLVQSMEHAFIVMWNVACDAIFNVHGIVSIENTVNNFTSDYAVVRQWFLLTRHSKHQRRKRQVSSSHEIVSTVGSSSHSPVTKEWSSPSHLLPSFSAYLSDSPVITMTESWTTKNRPSSLLVSTESGLHFFISEQSKNRYVKESLTTTLLVASNSEHVLNDGLITSESVPFVHVSNGAHVSSSLSVKAAEIEGTSTVFPPIHLSDNNGRPLATAYRTDISATGAFLEVHETQVPNKLTLYHDDISSPSYSASYMNPSPRENQGSFTESSSVSGFRYLHGGQTNRVHPSSAIPARFQILSSESVTDKLLLSESYSFQRVTAEAELNSRSQPVSNIIHSTLPLQTTKLKLFTSSILDSTTGLVKHLTNSLLKESVVYTDLGLSTIMYTAFKNFEFSSPISTSTEQSTPESIFIAASVSPSAASTTDRLHELYSRQSIGFLKEPNLHVGMAIASFTTVNSSGVSVTMQKSVSHHIPTHVSTSPTLISSSKTDIQLSLSPSFSGFPLDGSESVMTRSPEIIFDLSVKSSHFLSSVPHTTLTNVEYQGYQTAFDSPYVASYDILAKNTYEIRSSDLDLKVVEVPNSEEYSTHETTSSRSSLVYENFKSSDLATISLVPTSHNKHISKIAITPSNKPYSNPTVYQSITQGPSSTSLSEPHPTYLKPILSSISGYSPTNYSVTDYTRFEGITSGIALSPSSVTPIVLSLSNSSLPSSEIIQFSINTNFAVPQSLDSLVSNSYLRTGNYVSSSARTVFPSSTDNAVPISSSAHFSNSLEPSPSSILVSTYTRFPLLTPAIISPSTPTKIPSSTVDIHVSFPFFHQSSYSLLNPKINLLPLHSSTPSFTAKCIPICTHMNIPTFFPTSTLEFNSPSSSTLNQITDIGPSLVSSSALIPLKTSEFLSARDMRFSHIAESTHGSHDPVTLSLDHTSHLSITALDQSSVIKHSLTSTIDSIFARENSSLPSYDLQTTGITQHLLLSLDDSLSLSLPASLLHSTQEPSLDPLWSVAAVPNLESQSLLETNLMFEASSESHRQAGIISVPEELSQADSVATSSKDMDFSGFATQASDYDMINTLMDVSSTEIKAIVSNGIKRTEEFLTSVKVAPSSVGSDKVSTFTETTPMVSGSDEASTQTEATPIKSEFDQTQALIEATPVNSGPDETSLVTEATSVNCGSCETSILIEATPLESGFYRMSAVTETSYIQSRREEISRLREELPKTADRSISKMVETLSTEIKFEGISLVMKSEPLPTTIEPTLVMKAVSVVSRTIATDPTSFSLFPTSESSVFSDEVTSHLSMTTQLPYIASSVMTSILVSSALAKEPPFPTSMQPPSDASTKPNRAPILRKPLGRLSVGLGQNYQMVIPQDTFMDAEDGNTRNLVLALYQQSRADLPRNFWLQLNVTSQTIYGIPLSKDYRDHPIELVLSAMDSGGLVAIDTVVVSLDAVPLKDFSHDFILTLDMEETVFMASPDILIALTEKIRKYFGDNAPGSVSILSVHKGSVIVSWANNTLSKTVCQKDKIRQIYSKLSNSNGGVNAMFFSSMLPEFYVSKVTVRYRGICVPSMVDSPITTTGMSPKKHGTEWYEVVLPALIVVFVVLLILFVGVICFRRFHHRGKSVLRSEKDEFEEFGQPVAIQEEMELHEMNGKPSRPLVMATDPDEHNPDNDWVDERPPPPEYNVPDGKRLSQPLDYNPPVEPGYDNGAYQPPPVYRIPPSYTSSGQSVA